jgi:D-proline reductase (dithiol) PrdB
MDQPQTHRTFVSYIDRSREYYSAQGYDRPYAWAHHDDVPFTPLGKPLATCRVGLVTTAARTQRTDMIGPPLMLRELYAQPADPPAQRLFTDDLFWDKQATDTDDVDSFLPVNRLAEQAAGGRIGSASPRFYGVPTDYSQGRTREQAAPRILAWCREDGVDAVLLAGL